MNARRRLLRGALAWGIAAVAGSASAGGGVLEINHTCALRTGCFPGDAPGYPVEVSGIAGSSYRLTSDLVVGSEAAAITVLAGDVRIDLNGFAIVSERCRTATSRAGCPAGPAAQHGISLGEDPAVDGVEVHGGSVSGMGGVGISLGPRSRVRDVRVRWSGRSGIVVGPESTVVRSLAIENGGAGIEAGAGSRLALDVAADNGSFGILAGEGTSVEHSAVRDNAGAGIWGGNALAAHGNAASGNAVAGISGYLGSALSDNTAFDNPGLGIAALNGSSVQRNTARLNDRYGILLGSTASYLDNTVTSNAQGTVQDGIDMGGNLCGAGPACP